MKERSRSAGNGRTSSRRKLIRRRVIKDAGSAGSYLVAKKQPAQATSQKPEQYTEPVMATAETTGTSHPHENIWERWGRSIDWQNILHRRAAHKALDIPEEDMIDGSQRTNTTINGMGWKELAVVAAMGVGGYGVYNYNNTETTTLPTPAVTQPPEYPGPPDREYDVLFFDKDGNPIPVERLPTNLRKTTQSY